MAIKYTTCCGCCVWKLDNNIPHILLIKHDDKSDTWGIPKGHMDPDESKIQTAIRETWEETGILAYPTLMLLNPAITKHENEHKKVWCFIAKPDDEFLNINPCPGKNGENMYAQYFNINELPKLQYYQQKLIKNAVKIICKKNNYKYYGQD